MSKHEIDEKDVEELKQCLTRAIPLINIAEIIKEMSKDNCSSVYKFRQLLHTAIDNTPKS